MAPNARAAAASYVHCPAYRAPHDTLSVGRGKGRKPVREGLPVCGQLQRRRRSALSAAPETGDHTPRLKEVHCGGSRCRTGAGSRAVGLRGVVALIEEANGEDGSLRPGVPPQSDAAAGTRAPPASSWHAPDGLCRAQPVHSSHTRNWRVAQIRKWFEYFGPFYNSVHLKQASTRFLRH